MDEPIPCCNLSPPRQSLRGQGLRQQLHAALAGLSESIYCFNSIYLARLSLRSADVDYFHFAQQVIAPLEKQYFFRTESGSTVCCSSLVKRWGNANGG